MPSSETATERPGDPEGVEHTSRRGLKFDAALTAAAGIGVYGLALLTSPLTARALGPAGRGDLTAVVAPSQLFMWVLTFGMPAAAMFFARTYSRRQLVTAGWVFGAAVGIPLVAVLWFLIPGYLEGHDPSTVGWLRAFLVASIPFVAAYTAIDLKMSEGKVVAYNVLRTLPFAINAVLVVALAALGELTLRNALISQMVAHVAWLVVTFASTGGWPTRRFALPPFLRQLGYGARVAVGSLSDVVVARLDQILLVGFVAPAELGLYAIAVNVAGVSGPIASAVAVSVFPRLLAGTEEDVGRVSRQALRLSLLASVLIAAALAVLSPVLVPAVFGDDFRRADVVIWLLLPGQVAYNLAAVQSSRLNAMGLPGRGSQGQVLAAVLTLVGLAVFIGPFGINAAAAVTSASQAAQLAYVTYWVRWARRRTGTGPAETGGPASGQGGDPRSGRSTT